MSIHLKKFSKAGGRENEDFYLIGNTYIVVLDGATSLKEEKEGQKASWFVRELCKNLKAFILEDNISLQESLLRAWQSLEKEILSQTDVSASIVIARERNKRIEIYNLGDCTTYIQRKNGKTDCLFDSSVSKLDNRVLKRMLKISTEKDITVKEARQEKEIQQMLLKNRDLKNTEQGYYILDTKGTGIREGRVKIYSKDEVKSLLMMTDGFACVVDTYHLFESPIELMEFISKNPIESVYSQLTKVVKEDKDYNQFPRFKDIDDSTAVYIEFE